jgi:uncharacterized protein YutE (UPF0331/DUF86 family)
MMTSLASASGKDLERDYLERLATEYRARGYAFIVEPSPDQIPDFLGSYRPDAIALKGDMKVAIEVKQRPGPDPRIDRPLTEISRLFEGRPDWRFTVAYMASDPLRAIRIAPPKPAALRARTDEVRALLEAGQRRGAFVLSWSLLEAAFRLVESADGESPLSTGSVVQALAMRGLISPETEARVRRLIPLRHRLVHGDLDADPTNEEVGEVLAALDEAMREAQAA